MTTGIAITMTISRSPIRSICLLGPCDRAVRDRLDSVHLASPTRPESYSCGRAACLRGQDGQQAIAYYGVVCILLALIAQDVAPWLAWQYSSLAHTLDFA